MCCSWPVSTWCADVLFPYVHSQLPSCKHSQLLNTVHEVYNWLLHDTHTREQPLHDACNRLVRMTFACFAYTQCYYMVCLMNNALLLVTSLLIQYGVLYLMCRTYPGVLALNTYAYLICAGCFYFYLCFFLHRDLQTISTQSRSSKQKYTRGI